MIKDIALHSSICLHLPQNLPRDHPICGPDPQISAAVLSCCSAAPMKCVRQVTYSLIGEQTTIAAPSSCSGTAPAKVVSRCCSSSPRTRRRSPGALLNVSASTATCAGMAASFRGAHKAVPGRRPIKQPVLQLSQEGAAATGGAAECLRHRRTRGAHMGSEGVLRGCCYHF